MKGGYSGKLYRALNPVYAKTPLSGEGAKRYGGRFNPRGMPALYCSLSIMTAIREANQVGSLQPTTLVSYDAAIEAVFDSTAAVAREAELIDQTVLSASAWRDEMVVKGESQSQTFARALITKGYHGLLVRSFAPGASENDLNLILWQWGDAPPFLLTLIDDEGAAIESDAIQSSYSGMRFGGNPAIKAWQNSTFQPPALGNFIPEIPSL